MTYRDRALACPRCKVDLSRSGTADVWTCSKCAGELISVEHVIEELIGAAPDLAPASRRAVDLTTLGRRPVAPLFECSSCGRPMDPVYLGGIEVDRCTFDQLMWFDAGELDAVLDRAEAQRRERGRNWLERLLGRDLFA